MVDRRVFTAGLAASVAAVLAPAARAAVPRAKSVLLIHGAYADGSSWVDVVPHLQRAGLAVAAVQNPLTSLTDDVATTRKVLATLDGPVVLAGHSYAGTVVTETGLDPKVSALVYVAARAPDAGEDYTALAARFPAPPASAGLVHGQGQAWLSEEAFVRDFANGVDHERARALFAVQGRIADSLFTGRVTQAAWRSKPSFYAISKNDRTTSPELERFLAQRMKAQTIELDSGHLSIITHARQIADLILRAAGVSA
jgi:pimeloyl-ACP methyl ester carboxylesterase